MYAAYSPVCLILARTKKKCNLCPCRSGTPPLDATADPLPAAGWSLLEAEQSRCSSQTEAPLHVTDWHGGPRVPRLQLRGLARPPSSLSQDSLLGSPLYRPPSPSYSLGSLRSSTAFSSYLSSPRLGGSDRQPPPVSPPAPYPAGKPAGQGRAATNRPLGGGSLLADILNLKHSLALDSPAASSLQDTWGSAAANTSSSMHSLDASLQRLAQLTGGLGRRR